MTALQSTLIDQAREWADSFSRAISSGDEAQLSELFADPAYWRDVVALTWAPHTFSGRDQVVDGLRAAPLADTLRLELDEATPVRQVVRAGVECVEAVFTMCTAVGTGRAVARLIADGDRLRAWTLGTVLENLTGHEERVGPHRPSGAEWSRSFSGPNWRDQRRALLADDAAEPTVLVVGGGQAGLSAAARLRTFGIDALIIDTHAAIGDNWRTRYHSLTLHNETWVNHLPYLPFPDNWPTYIPKDKLADWLAAYVEAMELRVWTDTALISAEYDDASSSWTATVRKGGSGRTLRPRHIVMATGTSGPEYIPDIPGLASFAGETVHSGRFTDAEQYAGRPAVVIGTGTSGHDVAQELHAAGAHVTMVQRGRTLVSNVGPDYAGKIYSLYGEGLPTETCDLITAATPYPVMRRAQRLVTREVATRERPLHDALEAAGFRTTLGEDDTGWQILYQSRGGGYYLNVGCSELIAAGEITIAEWEDVERVTERGLQLGDGSAIDADLIVMATGYLGQDVLLRRLFGDEVASRVGPVWGFSEEGELRNLWSPTGQPGLWFIAGSLAQCRIFSRTLALQIQARELGLVPPEYAGPRPGGQVRAEDL
ncbi:NAD(P)-binding domain-containing protein [Epidermidibacterium keratini]|uniref:NAD(P)-binding domain-containing protein n=1 Tax=Epidermidibacterium keratini TaxID=1891644 RepID=A0A7M3T517_9ACTN|nr:NAD(P)/FAD-dependent oxidoreductase [Epidermidibacterium keratini]QHB98872.1 NAD(P)-binding domain-containing protein [Epidermidibacterium keratini]